MHEQQNASKLTRRTQYRKKFQNNCSNAETISNEHYRSWAQIPFCFFFDVFFLWMLILSTIILQKLRKCSRSFEKNVKNNKFCCDFLVINFKFLSTYFMPWERRSHGGGKGAENSVSDGKILGLSWKTYVFLKNWAF